MRAINVNNEERQFCNEYAWVNCSHHRVRLRQAYAKSVIESFDILQDAGCESVRLKLCQSDFNLILLIC